MKASVMSGASSDLPPSFLQVKWPGDSAGVIVLGTQLFLTNCGRFKLLSAFLWYL